MSEQRTSGNMLTVLLLVALLPTSAVASDAPTLSSNFFGTVTAGGQSVPEGMVLSAWHEGTVVAETSVAVTYRISCS